MGGPKEVGPKVKLSKNTLFFFETDRRRRNPDLLSVPFFGRKKNKKEVLLRKNKVFSETDSFSQNLRFG
jgi:hypothetical protein